MGSEGGLVLLSVYICPFVAALVVEIRRGVRPGKVAVVEGVGGATANACTQWLGVVTLK